MALTMADNKLLPLLSNSFREILLTCVENHKSKIAEYLLNADAIIEGFNQYYPDWLVNANTERSYPERYRYLIQWKEDTFKKLDSLINDSIRMLTLREDDFELSFLPKGKDPKYSSNGIWSKENRQTGKPTRLLQKLIVSKEFSNADFEVFNNQLRATSELDNNFKLVSGEDITYWYDVANYYLEAGTLGNSCMRYDSCSNFFEIYEDHAEMLILTKNNKLLGRAIVWTYKGRKYVDRIYVCKDHLLDKFIAYIKSNNWVLREDQSFYSTGESSVRWFFPEDNYETPEDVRIEIKINKIYDDFPYLDTLRYLNDNGRDGFTISQQETSSCIGYLDDTEGGYSSVNQFCCNCCGDELDEDSVYYNDWNGEDLCCDCTIWSNIQNTYLRADDAVSVYFDSMDDSDYAMPEFLRNYPEKYIFTDNWYFADSPLLNKDDETKD